jgi:hypothetical protein
MLTEPTSFGRWADFSVGVGISLSGCRDAWDAICFRDALVGIKNFDFKANQRDIHKVLLPCRHSFLLGANREQLTTN